MGAGVRHAARWPRRRPCAGARAAEARRKLTRAAWYTGARTRSQGAGRVGRRRMANVEGRPRQGVPYVLSKGGGVLSKGGGSARGDRSVGGDRPAGRDGFAGRGGPAGGGVPAGGERPGGRQRWRGGRGPLAFLRRAVLAGLAALVALGGGILLAYGWQALSGPHASGSSGTPAAAVPS